MPESIAIPKEEFQNIFRKFKGAYAQMEHVALLAGLIQPKDALLTDSERSDKR